MANQRGNEINVREEQAPQTTNQRRVTELELVVQRLQHHLRIYKHSRAVEDDVEIVEEKVARDEEIEDSNEITTRIQEILIVTLEGSVLGASKRATKGRTKRATKRKR